MKSNIYVMYDTGAMLALTPIIVSRNDVVPIREITEAVNGPNENLIKNTPQEFDLIQVGQIDLETGRIEPTDHRHVVNAADLKK